MTDPGISLSGHTLKDPNFYHRYACPVISGDVLFITAKNWIVQMSINSWVNQARWYINTKEFYKENWNHDIFQEKTELSLDM